MSKTDWGSRLHALRERLRSGFRLPALSWSDLVRILALARPYTAQLAAGIALILVNTAIALVIPLGLRELVDTVFQASPGLLGRLALGLLLLFAIQGVVSFLGRYLLSCTGERVLADFRTRVYGHLQRLSLRFFNEQRTGDLTSRLTNDVAAVRAAVTAALAELLAVSFRLIGSVALILSINWRLGLLIFLVAPGGAVATRYFGARLRRLSRDVQDRLAEATTITEEALSSMRVVTAFGRARYETRRYSEAVERIYDTAKHKALIGSFFSAFITFLFYSAVAVLFWYGGRELLVGRLTMGDLVACLLYALNISQGIRNLASVYTVFTNATGASARLFELLNTAPEVCDSPTAVPLTRIRGSIAFEDVSFGYHRGEPVLQGVWFRMSPGEKVAVVGPSGAGKSTLLNLIPRFYDPDSGRVLVDRHDVRSVTVSSLRDHIALVSQSAQLFDGTIRENIRYGRLDATEREVMDAAEAANAHGFVTALPHGYDTRVGERGVMLSGGQRQRVAIARALLKGAPILLLDEATSSLDSESELLVKQALERLMENRTALVIAHRLATVRDLDRILVLERGRLIEEGTHAELTARRGLYSRLAKHQFGLEPVESWPQSAERWRGEAPVA